jgi:hypothetical protein
VFRFLFQQDGLRSSGIEVPPTELDVGTKEHEPSRGELEAAWRERLDHTLTRYREKSAITRLLMTERLALPLSERPDPDGGFALDQALRRESEARREYKRVLTIFSDLILQGTVPDEDP